MEIKKIYFDMDGVLADFEKGVRELCGIDAYSQNVKRPKGYDDLLWEKVRGVENFYDRLDILPGAKEMFDTVRGIYGDRCEILTGIPKPYKGVLTAAEDKISWMRRLLSKDIVMNIVYRDQKKDYCTGPDCILIDDMVKTIKQWNELGGTGVLHVSVEKTMEELKKLGVL
jgi:phosphoglycolate phosphatase-like HAD superfamily hydrolase